MTVGFECELRLALHGVLLFETKLGDGGEDQILVLMVVWLGMEDVRRGQFDVWIFEAAFWASRSLSEMTCREPMMLISA